MRIFRRNKPPRQSQPGTPITIDAVAIKKPTKKTGLIILPTKKIRTGYLTQPLPLYWHTPTGPTKIGQIHKLEQTCTHLRAHGVIIAASRSHHIINTITTKTTWVFPDITYHTTHHNTTKKWTLTSIHLSPHQRHGMWNQPDITPITIYTTPFTALIRSRHPAT